MCPACVSNLAIMIFGLSSTSGLAALVLTATNSNKNSNEVESEEGKIDQDHNEII